MLKLHTNRQSPNGAERRSPRTQLRNVDVESPGLDLVLLELSPVGLSIETDRCLRVGDNHQFKLHHKNGIVEADGEVRWCRLQLKSEGSGPSYRSGFSLSGAGLVAPAPASDSGTKVEPEHHSRSVARWLVEAAPLPPQVRPPGVVLDPEAGPEEYSEASKIDAVHEILEKRLLRVVFQPIYNLKRGHVFAYEALARCSVPGLSNLPELYRVAAKAGLIGELGRQHRTQVVEQAPDLPLSINVNPHEFDYGWLVQPDDPIFRHSRQVLVEVTENVPVARFQQCLGVLGELRAKGIQVAIDDFGSGFCNLGYLADLEPDFVKIDRSLIAGVRDSSRRYRLLESIIAMCKNLGSRVIVEGVEHAEELVAIDHAGAEFCQGYLLGRPELPASGESWPAFR